MSFPNIRPSSRKYTPGDWPVKTFNSVNGSELRILRGSNRTNARLDLQFTNISDDEARLFLLDYYARQGTFKSWHFDPASSRKVFHGWDAAADKDEGDTSVFEASPYGMQWRYEAEPEVEQVRPGISSISVKLIGIITSTMPSIDASPTVASIATVTPILDKGILIDGVFLRSSALYTMEGGRIIAGRMPLAYYARTVPFGQGRVPGLNWATDEDWTTADLSRINKWKLFCFRDIIDDDGRDEQEKHPARGDLLARTGWDYPSGGSLRAEDRKYGTGPLSVFAKSAESVGTRRQTLMEISDIPVDANVTTGGWTRKAKSLTDGASSLPSSTGNDWTGSKVFFPSTADTWADSKYDEFRALYPAATSVSVPGEAESKILWAGPQARLSNSPTRYFFVVLALDSTNQLLSMGSLVFTAPNIDTSGTTWPPIISR